MRWFQKNARGVLVLLAVSLGVLVGQAWSDDGADGALPESQAQLEARIGQLIQQLGSPQYATRQRAKTQLRQLRLEAFDALNEAQSSDDIEIAMSARYLVQSMQVNWWTEEDPPEIKQLLREYGTRPESERRNLLEQLSHLGWEFSFRPLSRLVRYEASEHLSKRAALLALAMELPDAPGAEARCANQLLEQAGTSRRAAAQWLRAYAALLVDDPRATARWDELVTTELTRLADTPDQTNKEATRDLLKWYADTLARRERQAEALAMMRKSLELLDPRYEDVLDAVDWFRSRQHWAIVLELADRYTDTFQRHPMLQYRLAETYRQLQQSEQAEQAAQLAMKAVPNEPAQHRELGANLQRDGLFEWAEHEYRHVAARVEDDAAEAVRAQILLSEMLHDVGREQEAGETLRALVEIIQAREELAKMVEEDLGRELPAIKSRMCYFFALHHRQLKEHGRERELLLEGITNDPHDADVLIAMFGSPEADDAWRGMTRQRVTEAAKSLRVQLTELGGRLNEGSFEDRAWAAYELAVTNNQLAWLLANTDGDADEALRCSQRSLELQPHRAGFLDTLGRCYYAKKDYENAVKYQLQAVALEPHSPLLIKQLEAFQEALRQQQASADAADSADGAATDR